MNSYEKDFKEGIDHAKWLIGNKISVATLIECVAVNEVDDECTEPYCSGFNHQLTKHFKEKINEKTI